jgi:hypothetical protein
VRLLLRASVSRGRRREASPVLLHPDPDTPQLQLLDPTQYRYELKQIFPSDLDAIFLLSSNTSVSCHDPRGAMLLSTLPPRWERHLQGLENPGLLRIGAGQARHAGGLIQGIGQ